MKIEVGKLYSTRSGEKVRIYALDGWGHPEKSIHGAHLVPTGWMLSSWNLNGTYIERETSHMDLVSEWIEEPVKPKLVTWYRPKYVRYTNQVFWMPCNTFSRSKKTWEGPEMEVFGWEEVELPE